MSGSGDIVDDAFMWHAVNPCSPWTLEIFDTVDEHKVDMIFPEHWW